MLGGIVTISIGLVMSALNHKRAFRGVFPSRNLLEHDPDGDADPHNRCGENHQKSIDVQCHGASFPLDRHNAPVPPDM
jgi:hypothetical protein